MITSSVTATGNVAIKCGGRTEILSPDAALKAAQDMVSVALTAIEADKKTRAEYAHQRKG